MYLYIELVVNVRFVSAESDRPSEHQQQRSEDSRRSACMYMLSSTLLLIEPLHCTVTPLSCFPSFLSLFSSLLLLSSPLPSLLTQRNVTVHGLTEQAVTGPEEIAHLLIFGESNNSAAVVNACLIVA